MPHIVLYEISSNQVWTFIGNAVFDINFIERETNPDIAAMMQALGKGNIN
jgi:hypothetical protein